MYQNMSTLSELKHKQIHLQQQILELKNDMETFNVRLVSWNGIDEFINIWLSFLTGMHD